MSFFVQYSLIEMFKCVFITQLLIINLGYIGLYIFIEELNAFNQHNNYLKYNNEYAYNK